MSDSISFALVGAGGIAQSYAQAFEGHPAARLAAVVDIRAEAAQAMAERAVCPAFTSYEALLTQGPKIDAAILCTPPNTHEAVSAAFLRAGVHVLCEKPFTLERASAVRMIRTAEQSGRMLTMASKFRYVSDVIRAKSLVASGTIGDVILFENAFTGRVDMANRWNSKPEISGGGVLIDNGTHSVDVMRYFLGPLDDVHALEGKRVQGLAVEDTVRLFVRMRSGVMGSVDLSWSINKELESYIQIYGSQGTLTVGWRESKYKRHGERDWTVFGKGYDKVQAFRDQIGNFAAALQGEQTLLISATDALASVEAIEAAYASMRSAGWTRLGAAA